MAIYRVTLNDGVQFLMDATEDDRTVRYAPASKLPVHDNLWADLPYSWRGSGSNMEGLASKVAMALEMDDWNVAEIVELARPVMPEPRSDAFAHQFKAARGAYPLNEDSRPKSAKEIVDHFHPRPKADFAQRLNAEITTMIEAIEAAHTAREEVFENMKEARRAFSRIAKLFGV